MHMLGVLASVAIVVVAVAVTVAVTAAYRRNGGSTVVAFVVIVFVLSLIHI